MSSRTRTFSTTPRLNYRQSTIMDTPSDKSIPSSPCYDTNNSKATGVITEEPYCAASPPPESSAVTNKTINTHSDNMFDKDDTSSSDCGETLSITNDSHSLLLRKATSQSSMNLTTLLDNGTPLQHDDIIPRPTKSEPYSFTLIQQEENDGDDDWNNKNTLDSDDGGGTERLDTTDLDDAIWIKRKTLETRLLNIITKTIDHELKRHPPTTTTSSQQQQQQLMTIDDDHSQFDKDDRSSDPSGAPSSSSPSPSVSQWWRQQHVALEKTISTQQQIFTTTIDELKRRLDSLERAQQEYILQQQQQQTKNQQNQDSRDEIKKYDALHARYIDLVTQHSHQLEKYQQLEQAHLTQSSKLRSLELKQPQQPQRSTYRQQPPPPPPPTSTTMLPSPPLNSVQKQYKTTDDQQNINLDQQKKKRNTTTLDRQHQHQFRHSPQHYSNHSPNVTSPPTNTYNNSSITYQQKSRYYPSSAPILPTPNASPTSTTIITPPKEASKTQPLSSISHQKQQSFKMDDGYVEFMTECNGEPVLCRVKVPTKDAEMHGGYTKINKSSSSSAAAAATAPFVSQSRQTKPYSIRYHHHQQQQQQQQQYQQYQNNGNSKDMSTRGHSPVVQTQYHTSSPSPRDNHHHHHHHHHHPQSRQQQQQQQYQYHPSNPYQHPYKPCSSPLSTTMNKKALNPDAPVWTGSWNSHH